MDPDGTAIGLNRENLQHGRIPGRKQRPQQFLLAGTAFLRGEQDRSLLVLQKIRVSIAEILLENSDQVLKRRGLLGVGIQCGEHIHGAAEADHCAGITKGADPALPVFTGDSAVSEVIGRFHSLIAV